METCANCRRTIGDLETPFVFRDRIVCAACDRFLNKKPSSHRALIVGISILAIAGWGLALLKMRQPHNNSTPSGVQAGITSGSNSPSAAPTVYQQPAQTYQNLPAPDEIVLKEAESHSLPEMTPQSLLAAAIAFAPTLAKMMKSEDERISENADKTSRESAKKAGLEYDFDGKTSVDYSVISVDIEKTDSLIHPIVALIKLHRYWLISSERNPITNTWLDATDTVRLSPTDGGGWKCLSAQDHIESDHPVDNEAPRTGETSDWTERVTGVLKGYPPF